VSAFFAGIARVFIFVLGLGLLVPHIGRAATNTYSFTYTNRTALLADGWSFIGRTITNSVTRNTEITDTNVGAVVAYAQTNASLGIVTRIPVDVGFLFSTPYTISFAVPVTPPTALANATRNSLFRNLPTNWVSARLSLSFIAQQNYQHAGLVLYQDDDDYVSLSYRYNSDQASSFGLSGPTMVGMDYEFYGFPNTERALAVNTTNIVLRFDRDTATENVTGFYSLDGGTNWVTVAQCRQALTNLQFGIVMGASPATFPLSNLPNCDLSQATIITSDTYTSPPPVMVAQPQSLVFSAPQGQACAVTQRVNVIVKRSAVSPVNFTVSSNATWITAVTTNAQAPGFCDVSVNTTGLAAGVYQGTLSFAATGPTNSPVTVSVNLIVNPTNRVSVSLWHDGKPGAMSVSVDDSYPTAFDDLSTNGVRGSYMMWHLTAPSFYSNYYYTAGMELGAHTVDHPCFPLTEPERRYQFETNIAGLAASVPIPQSQIISFAWPCGENTPEEEIIASDYLLACRGFDINLLEDATPYDFMNLKSFNGHDFPPVPPTNFNQIVDSAIAQGKWYNMVLHDKNIDDGAIQYASTNHIIWMAPMGVVTKYILQRNRTIITNYVEGANTIQFDMYRLPIPGSSIRSFETAVLTNDDLTFAVNAAGISVFGVTVAGVNTPFTNSGSILTFNTPVKTNVQTVVLTLQANIAPTLPVQTNTTINELSLLTVTNTGSDANIPAQTLSYTVLATNVLNGTVQTNVSISSNGVITWTPTEAQGPSTNVLTTVVTDNGSPPLSATNSFTVVVNEVNTAPVLPAQNNRTINGQSQMVVTNTATDSDLPVNPLGYTLTVTNLQNNSVVTNATIDTNGVIRWLPTALQYQTTNLFTTIVTDTNVFAVNAQNLSATNTFTVIVATNPPLFLPPQTNRTIGELTQLVVTNTAVGPTNGPGAGSVTTNTVFFTYTNRNAFLNDGWSFFATNPDGTPRNTEITDTNVGVVTYAQTNNPLGLVLKIPCDLGDIWSTANNNRNAIFRNLSANWMSMQLRLTFNPVQDYQQTELMLYQDDDNYVELGFLYNSGQKVTFSREIGGSPAAIASTSISATNISLRLDRNVNTGDITSFYSLDGTNWVSVGVIGQAFANTELGIWSGGATVPYATTLTTCGLSRLDVAVTNTSMLLNYTLAVTNTLDNSQVLGATIDNNGIIRWLPSEAQGPGNYSFTTTVTDGNTISTNSFIVTVAEVNTAPTLPPQGDLTILGGNSVVITNTATDTDIPANPMGYQLTAAPAGATIDTNGVIRWTPTAAQVPSTNTFTTVVTDTNSAAINSQNLSATNRFVIIVLPEQAPTFPNPNNVTINELTLMTVTNTATNPNVITNVFTPIVTNAFYLNYPNRNAFFADGWNFIEYSNGVVTDTEVLDTNVGVIAYAQTNATFGTVMRVPCDTGDLWDTTVQHLYNYTKNSLFRALPTNWMSMRLTCAFGPFANFQQVHITCYQDNDNYVESGFAYNDTVNTGPGGKICSMVWETAANANHFTTPVDVSFTNITLRVDKDAAGDFTTYYSTNAAAGNWVMIGSITPANWSPNPALGTPRLMIWVGSNPVPYSQSPITVDFAHADIVLTNGVNNASVTQAYTYTLLNPPAGATIDSSGVIRWTPTEAQGPTNATIRTIVSDGVVSATNTFTVTVNEVNTAPTLPAQTNRTLVGLQSMTVTNTATDTDIPVNPLGYRLVSPPSGAAINTNGVITWTPSPAQVPSTNIFTTIVTDTNTAAVNSQHLTATNSFTVFVVAPARNGPSLPVQPNRTNNELVALTITNTASDSDLPPPTLAYTLVVTNVADGSVVTNATISNSGVIHWTPTEAQGPGVYSLRTVVTDNGAPPLSATNVFTVTVNEVNSAPTLPVQTNRTINELTLMTVTNTATDTDVPPNALAYILTVTNVADGSVVTNASISTNGVITWTPSEAQGPGVYSLRTIVTDNGVPPLSATNAFTVTVNEVNSAPSLPVQTNLTINELTLMTVTNTATDTDIPANTLTYVLTVTNVADGSVVTNASISTNGVITWTPSEAQGPGVYSLRTIVTDNGVPPLSATNAFTVTVNEVNSAPSLPVQTNLTINELTLMTVTNTATDTDIPANTLTYVLTVTNLADNSIVTNASIDTNGIITWTPTEAQGPGTNTFTTIVSDGSLTATNSFTVTVLEVNSPPSLPVQTNRTINELTYMVVTNTATDSDLPANILTYALSGPPGSAIDTNGIITWTPDESQGPGVYNLITVVTDNGTPQLSATNSFTVTVLEVNSAPVLPLQTNRTINELTLVTITNAAVDTDLPPNPLTYTLTVTNLADNSVVTNASIDTNGVITWTPTEDQGPSTNVFTTVVSDGQATSVNWFTIVVNEVNSAPVLPTQTDLTIGASQSLTVTNTATDSDIPVNSLTYVLLQGPTNASIDTNGIITWTPTSGQAGSTNVFETVVTDYNPVAVNAQNLSATNFFNVVVNAPEVVPPPFIESISVTPDGNVIITWTTVTNHFYRLQYKDNITDTNWNDILPDLPATQNELSATNAIGIPDQRFYRVLITQ
jgi:regulation of enolase protein 1 (concanavalin A-like superfamily)